VELTYFYGYSYQEIATLMKEREPKLTSSELILRLHDSALAPGTVEAIPMVDICHAVMRHAVMRHAVMRHAVMRIEDEEVCTQGAIGHIQ